MCIFNVSFSFCFLFVIIISSVRCESEEEEPIPELNDFDEAYRLFEYAKTTLNPLASFPFVSTTNKEIAEYLLLRVGVSKWRRTIRNMKSGSMERPSCVIHRLFKDSSIKHDIFQEKKIKIKKEFGTYEEHTIAFQYNWHANKKKIEMLKCPCYFETRIRLHRESSVLQPNFVDENELKLLENTGKVVKLRIIPTTKLIFRDALTSLNRISRDGLPNIDEYPYQSSEENFLRVPSLRLFDKVSARLLLDRDICINGHVFLGRGVNGDKSFFVFARDRGFLRVVAHLVLR